MRKPDLHRVLGNIEVNDLPSVVAEDDHGVEQPERRATTNMSIATVSPMRLCRKLRQVGEGTAGLAHYDTELEQLAVDAWRAPQRIGDAHFADQITGFHGRLGPSRMAGF